MVHVKSCWTPCFWHGNVYEGSLAVTIYSMAMSICILTYTSYVMNGGDSSQLWLPYFEANLVKNLQFYNYNLFMCLFF